MHELVSLSPTKPSHLWPFIAPQSFTPIKFHSYLDLDGINFGGLGDLIALVHPI
jgi:hypothetical protein